MKIATYNINGINGRLDKLLRWLEQANPDVVCLQELKCENSRFPEKALREAGYHAVWKGEKSWNGVAILSRESIKLLREDLPGEDESFNHSRYIEGFTLGMVIGCLYLPNGNPYPGPKFDYKLRWFERLIRHGQTLLDTRLPVMLIGDYNVIPTELDTYKPEKYKDNALFRPEIRRTYAALLKQGWTDAIRELFPGERIYTFWDYLRKAYSRDAGLRLDHFLLNPGLADRLKSGGVDKEVRGWEKSSDHAPVWIELKEDTEAEQNRKPASEKAKGKTAKTAKKQKASLEKKGIALEEVLPDHVQALLEKAPEAELPRDIKAMKAKEVDQPFHQEGWVYEIKWDGYRALAFSENGSAALVSTKNLICDHFSRVNELIASWGLDLVLDGEITVLDESGMPVFEALQNWNTQEQVNLVYYVSDILWFQGKLLTGYTLLERRAILKAVLPREDGLVRISHFFDADGVSFYQTAKKMKLEGIIAKKENSTYTPGARSGEWLIVKARQRQQLVIADYDRHEESGDADTRPPEEAALTAGTGEPSGKERSSGMKRHLPDQPLLEGKSETSEKKIDGHVIKFTNLNKLYWPEDRITKRDMFNYYDQVAPYMVPYLLDRPMSLNRFPGGIHGQSFYQKNVAGTAPDWAHTMPHINEKGEQKAYLLGYDRATLLWMATLGCIEMNPWFSRAQSPDNPDYCVIDLDPDKNTFEQVIEAARVTRSVLSGMGVPSYVKTSGSTGIHIYVPLGAKYTYEQSQLFAQVVVKLVHRELPAFTTLERMISNRKGKMYLDFLQNRPGATIAGVYSLRPKPGATVSMPLYWEEVKPGLTMRDFTIHNAPDRLREVGDIFTGVLAEGIDMAAAISKARETFG